MLNTNHSQPLMLQKKALKGNYKDYIGKTSTFQSELSEAQLKKIGEPNYNSISVDAASSGNPGKNGIPWCRHQNKKTAFIYKVLLKKALII